MWLNEYAHDMTATDPCFLFQVFLLEQKKIGYNCGHGLTDAAEADQVAESARPLVHEHTRGEYLHDGGQSEALGHAERYARYDQRGHREGEQRREEGEQRPDEHGKCEHILAAEAFRERAAHNLIEKKLIQKWWRSFDVEFFVVLFSHLAAKVADGKGGQDPSLGVHVPFEFGRHLQHCYGHDGPIGRVDQVWEGAKSDRLGSSQQHYLLFLLVFELYSFCDKWV